MQRMAKRGAIIALALPLLGGAALGNVAHSAGSAGVPDFTRIVEQNREAVVNVSTTQEVSAKESRMPREFLEQLPPGHPLKRFFERFGGGASRRSATARRWAPASSSRPTATC